MNCEEMSHRNLVHHYHEEIQRISDGEDASAVLDTRNERRHLSKHGVLERVVTGKGSRLMPTATTLKYMREYGYI